MEKPDAFQMRSYGFQELAQLYSPGISPGSASKQMRRWIRFSPTLTDELRQAGWQAGSRVLTPRQVKIIIRHLDQP